jgi:hypothetical protein
LQCSATLILDELALSFLVEDAACTKGALDDVGVMVKLVISSTLATDIEDGCTFKFLFLDSTLANVAIVGSEAYILRGLHFYLSL